MLILVPAVKKICVDLYNIQKKIKFKFPTFIKTLFFFIVKHSDKLQQKQGNGIPLLSALVNWEFFDALWWLILAPGHYENWQKLIWKVIISQTENVQPYIQINSQQGTIVVLGLKNHLLFDIFA